MIMSREIAPRLLTDLYTMSCGQDEVIDKDDMSDTSPATSWQANVHVSSVILS